MGLLGKLRSVVRRSSRVPRFEAALRRNLASVADHPMHRTYLEYGLSCLDRGAEVVRAVSRFAPVSGRRCLDIGRLRHD